MADYILETKQLSKTIKRRSILEDVSMHVTPCEIYGLIGGRGCGKTMLLKMIANLVTPSKGEIILGGYNDQVYTHAHVGTLIGNGDLNQHVRLKDLLLRQCGALHIKKAKAHIHELLSLLGITSLYRSYPDQLSDSEKKMAALALAFVGYPQLIVLDEPFTLLNPDQVSSVKHLIRELASQDVTFIITSKDGYELSDLATHYGVLENGHLSEYDHFDPTKPTEVVLALNTSHQDEAMNLLQDYQPKLLRGMILMNVYDDQSAYKINQLLYENDVPFEELTFIQAHSIGERGDTHVFNDQI